MIITTDILAAGTGASYKVAAEWLPHIQATAAKFDIASTPRIACWLANIGVESASLSRIVENLDYSGPGLLATWPRHFTQIEAEAYAKQPIKIANRVYADRMGNGNEASGDGAKYMGRGLMQITGRANYEHQAGLLGLDLVNHPELLELPANAALAAGQYWHDAGLAALADVSNFRGVCAKINTGSANSTSDKIEGYPIRLKFYGAALKAIG